MKTARIRTSRLCLASGSPRRQELLESLGLDFVVSPSGIDETRTCREAPGDYARRIAKRKALEVAAHRTDDLIIAADTIVVVDEDILGKPTSLDEARKMLRALSGRWHEVLTALCLIAQSSGHTATGLERTQVKFARLTRAEIDWYLSTGEYADKAGGYAIQGYGSLLIERIEGDYFNVVGLPIRLFYKLATRLGVDLKELVKPREPLTHAVKEA
jgi:septum formation protein